MFRTTDRNTRIASAANPGEMAVINVIKGNFSSVRSTFDESTFELGYDGHAEMFVRSGASATFDLLFLGSRSGTGVLEVNGADAVVDVDNSFMVGRMGTGEVRVLSGGVLRTNGNNFGPALEFDRSVGLGIESSLAHGAALVDGAGSQWIVDDELIVGQIGTGEITISNGGYVESQSAVLASNTTGANGTVVVTGNGSRWHVPNSLSVGPKAAGVNSVGTVEVRDGGLLETASVGGATLINEDSSVLVTGAGSEWRDNNRVTSVRAPINVDGLLTVADGGKVTASDITLEGRLHVTGANSNLDATFGGTNGIVSDDPNASILVEGGGFLESFGGRFSVAQIEITGAGSRWDARTAPLSIGGLAFASSVLRVADDAVADSGDVTVGLQGVVEFDDGTLNANSFLLESGGTVRGNGSLPAPVEAAEGSTIQAQLGTLNLGDATSSSGFISRGTVDAGAGTLILNDLGPARLDGQTLLSGGDIQAANGIELGGDVSTISGFGTINTRVLANANSTISSNGGTLTLGDSTRFDGFRTEGVLDVGSDQMVIESSGFASLGVETRLNGGTLTAANGLALSVGDNVIGEGTVNGRIAQGIGSLIEATGNLELGDAGSVSGFFSDGEIYANTGNVVIYDANVAVLGSVTQLGDGASGGTLTAGNASVLDTSPHLLIEEGKNLTGRGHVVGNLKNNGAVVGDGTALDERLTFDAPWIVSGKGTFENTLVLGTFSGGESPGIVNGTNQAFGGTLEFELGGLEPGFGNNNHDQINDSAAILLIGDPALSILPFNSFVPDVGDEFTILTWATGLDGTFGDVLVDPFFASNGLRFDLLFTNTVGPGNLTLHASAIPEPSTFVMLVACGLGFGLARHGRRRTHKP